MFGGGDDGETVAVIYGKPGKTVTLPAAGYRAYGADGRALPASGTALVNTDGLTFLVFEPGRLEGLIRTETPNMAFYRSAGTVGIRKKQTIIIQPEYPKGQIISHSNNGYTVSEEAAEKFKAAARFCNLGDRDTTVTVRLHGAGIPELRAQFDLPARSEKYQVFELNFRKPIAEHSPFQLVWEAESAVGNDRAAVLFNRPPSVRTRKVAFTPKPPVIDGAADDAWKNAEWAADTAVRSDVPGELAVPPEEFSSRAKFLWGDAGLYFLVAVKDKQMEPAPDPGSSWMYDSLQIAVSQYNSENDRNRFEWGFYLDGHGAPQKTTFTTSTGNKLSDDCRLAVRRDDKAATTVYEGLIPWRDLGSMRAASGSAGTLLPNYGVVVIDEAHTLEGNAAEHLGLHLSRIGIVSTLNRLYSQENTRGLLMRKGTDPALRGAVAESREEAYGFFTPYENLLRERNETALEIKDTAKYPNKLTEKLLKLSSRLSDYLDEQEDASFRTELEAQLTRCREFINGVDQFTNRNVPDAVYYAEDERGGVGLHATPLNIAELLSQLLFSQDYPVMLCSATLTVRDSFDYYLGRTGFCNGDTLLLDSPFGSDQARVYIPRGMPDPKDDDFQDALDREIPRFVEVTQGKAFVLFTSHASLRRTAEDLREYFRSKGWRLLVQGEEMTRSGLLREFREDIDSVLFGTDSFWTGVDVPGEALSNVIVTKLPFASPGHPLTAARMERIEREGKSSFAHYSLPEAVLKFRQGVGRLIRSRNDRGIVVVLDRRVITKNYGKLFLDSIPYAYEQV